LLCFSDLLLITPTTPSLSSPPSTHTQEDEEEASSSSGSSSGIAKSSTTATNATADPQKQGQQQPPPGYPDYLHANVRSVREPKRPHELVAPTWQSDPEGYLDGMAGLKASLSGQAADFVARQVRECGAVVRRKLYLRRLAAREAGKVGGAAVTAAAVGGCGGGGGADAAATALMLGQPGGLELLVDQCLDTMVSVVLSVSSGWGL